MTHRIPGARLFYQCPRCQKIWRPKNIEAFVRHLQSRSGHGELREIQQYLVVLPELQCRCPHVFFDPEKLRAHAKRTGHMNPRAVVPRPITGAVQCLECRTRVNASTFLRHRCSLIQCPSCSERFRSLWGFQQHSCTNRDPWIRAVSGGAWGMGKKR